MVSNVFRPMNINIVWTSDSPQELLFRFLICTFGRCVHTLHAFHVLHHRALRHGFLAHLHVLHHVLHHLAMHLLHLLIHGGPLFHQMGDDGCHQPHLLIVRRAVHRGDLSGEFGILRLHFCHHLLFLFLHLLAALHHFSVHSHLSFLGLWLGSLRQVG